MSQTTGLSRKLTSKAVAERYDVTIRTVERWTDAGILPQPMRINHIKYWDEEEIAQTERERMSRRKCAPEDLSAA